MTLPRPPLDPLPESWKREIRRGLWKGVDHPFLVLVLFSFFIHMAMLTISAPSVSAKPAPLPPGDRIPQHVKNVLPPVTLDELFGAIGEPTGLPAGGREEAGPKTAMAPSDTLRRGTNTATDAVLDGPAGKSEGNLLSILNSESGANLLHGLLGPSNGLDPNGVRNKVALNGPGDGLALSRGERNLNGVVGVDRRGNGHHHGVDRGETVGVAGHPEIGEKLYNPPPTPEDPTKAEIDGTMITADIQAELRRRFGAFRHCYEEELKANPSLAGNVRVAFAVTGAGAVSSCAVRSSTLAVSSVGDCVCQRIRRIPFGDLGEMSAIDYTFVFTPAD
ncbi:AgmX/PglI C-terminal domain-containing protein [bacterium]|nr:AgmX/PglI C-terminal domain-containing protein [bacterium]MCB9479190.1 AgmX/PglI C-terminal domain-containing protein [Deltaproteobacteria bacterium]